MILFAICQLIVNVTLIYKVSSLQKQCKDNLSMLDSFIDLYNSQLKIIKSRIPLL
jgi:hypothetical protein